jgi:hypothetical protein
MLYILAQSGSTNNSGMFLDLPTRSIGDRVVSATTKLFAGSTKFTTPETNKYATPPKIMQDTPAHRSQFFFLTVKGPKAPEAPLSGRHNYKEEPEHTAFNSQVLGFYKKAPGGRS